MNVSGVIARSASSEAIQFLLRAFLDCFAESALGQRGALIRVLAMMEGDALSELTPARGPAGGGWRQR